MNVELCKNDVCPNKAQRRGLCWKHYQRVRRMTDESRSTNRNAATPLSNCVCEVPKPGIIVWFTGRYADREPRPGDAIECRHCGRRIAS